MPVSTTIVWLKTASAFLLIAFGLMFAFSAWPPAAGLATYLVDMLFWPVDGAQSLAAPETRLVLAIGGGITVGWGVMIWLVADRLMPVNPALARSILLRSLLAWFVIDSICSWLSGGVLNIPVNILFLAAFLWPLLRMEQKPAASPS